jgi:hypothetical protein
MEACMSRMFLVILLSGSAGLGCGSDHTVAGLDGDPGLTGEDGAQGPAGVDGRDGVDGQDVLNCWDLNGDGIEDVVEDVNDDKVWDALDCQANNSPTSLGPFTVVNVSYDLKKQYCLSGGIETPDCCPVGFESIGARGDNEATVCLETKIATGRTVLKVRSIAGYYCWSNEDPGPCCPLSFQPVGYDEATNVICLENK